MLETTRRTPAHRFSSITRPLFFALLILVTILMLGCDKEKKSGGGGESGGGSESSANTGGGGGGGGAEHVGLGERKQEDETQKAQRVMRQLGNYMLGIVSAQGAPEDLDAAKAALKEQQNINWMNDPWGNAYNYEKTGDNTFRLFSSGPDGQPGTGDDIEGEL